MDAFERLKQEAAAASVARPPKALQLPQPKIPDPAVAKVCGWVVWSAPLVRFVVCFVAVQENRQ